MINHKYGGVAACVLLAAAATFLASVQSVVGAPMIGLLLGIVVMNLTEPGEAFFRGTKFCAKKVLSAAIIVAGATLNIRQIAGSGARALPLLFFNIALAFLVANLAGRKLGVSWNTRNLVGGGTCICGGTAIATIASVIKAKEQEIGYAMASIFFFDIFAALIYPYLASWLNLTSRQFGFLAGSSINDTSSVAAAESTYNLLNGLDSGYALTVKLTRTTLLILLVIAFTVIMARRESRGQGGMVVRTVLKSFPWFVLGFLLTAALSTFGVFDAAGARLGLMAGSLPSLMKTLFKFLTTVALCGVGFKIKFSELFTKGIRPVLLGGATWAALCASSIVFVLLFAGYINA